MLSSPHFSAPSSRSRLQEIAGRAMRARGLAPEFAPQAIAELNAIQTPAAADGPGVCDLSDLPWCSIDNDDSRDLDQLSVAEARANGQTRISVAIADVSAVVKPGSALDGHARQNTTSVYTAARIFPMFPEKLSTDLTSLNFAADRLALVVDMVFADDGSLEESDVYPARVRNQAKLAYRGVDAWLEGRAAAPSAVSAVPGLADNLRLQHRIADLLAQRRHRHGALTLETLETRPVFDGAVLTDLEMETPDAAKRLIEDMMIAANGVTARYLAAKNFPSIRRVVRTPAHWDRIVAIAAEHGSRLPKEADAPALEQFLVKARAASPSTFPDLSLCVIKLLGSGEYVLERPDEEATGHFGLAVRDYAHSTAPNRRYPDVITQRLLRAAMAKNQPPYDMDELAALAVHCTAQENAAKKVERQVAKSAAAMLLEPRLGQLFDAIVTGAAPKGTWVRIQQPPIEGKLDNPPRGLQVGDRLRVKLVRTDVEQGFIDFKSA
ncbi:MAG TPA: RNB domain-containing ribonuclease [Opitutaceae bacterium]|nr:RNB domain-containing ribonuclease [Opitutaceae bacterium]